MLRRELLEHAQTKAGQTACLKKPLTKQALHLSDEEPDVACMSRVSGYMQTQRMGLTLPFWDLQQLNQPFCKALHHRCASDGCEIAAYATLVCCGNLLVATQDGHAKIGDVGMAKIMSEGYFSHDEAFGTFAWAAPELLLNDRCTDKVDIYR